MLVSVAAIRPVANHTVTPAASARDRAMPGGGDGVKRLCGVDEPGKPFGEGGASGESAHRAEGYGAHGVADEVSADDAQVAPRAMRMAISFLRWATEETATP